MSLTYRVWPDLSHSEEVVDRFSKFVKLITPATAAKRDLDWIAEGGYADGDTTDNAAKPRALWSAKDNATNLPIQVWVDGVLKTATDLPFIVTSLAPKIPFFVYNVPRIIGLTYTVSVKFIMPGNPDRAATAEWTVTTVSAV